LIFSFYAWRDPRQVDFRLFLDCRYSDGSFCRIRHPQKQLEHVTVQRLFHVQISNDPMAGPF
jgi:hypothetical protein